MTTTKVTVLYEANDGWVAWGSFDHVDDAIAWAKPRFPEFFIAPLHDAAEFEIVVGGTTLGDSND